MIFFASSSISTSHMRSSFFPFSLSLSMSHSHTELSEKLMFSLSFFFVFMLTCLSRHNFSNPIIVAFPIATLRFISLSHLPSFSTSDPRNVKLDTTSISSPSISKLLAVVIIFVFFMLKYRPAFSLSLFSLLISFTISAFSCHQCCVICISQIVQCLSCYFHSFLCLFHFCFSHYPLCIQVE